MATQAQVIQSVNDNGFYSARLYEFIRSTRGLNEVSPARKLVEKGVLILKDAQKITFSGGEYTEYVWVKKDLTTNDETR